MLDVKILYIGKNDDAINVFRWKLTNKEENMQTRDNEKIRQSVRDSYGKIAKAGEIVDGLSPAASCCGPAETSAPAGSTASCCGGPEVGPGQISALMGYSKKDI